MANSLPQSVDFSRDFFIDPTENLSRQSPDSFTGDGVFIIQYPRKDLNEIKDTKCPDTYSKLDSSIDRYVKLIDHKKNNAPNGGEQNGGSGNNFDDKHDSKTDGENFDEYCLIDEDGIFQCLHCSQKSTSIEEFKKHYKDAHLIFIYSCRQCGFDTCCFGVVTDHVSQYHHNDTGLVRRKVYRISCDENQSTAENSQQSTSSNSSNESSSSREVLCFFTGEHKELNIGSDEEGIENEISEDDEEIGEIELKTNNGTARQRCHICLQEFTRSERVREHYEAIHMNIVYICCICSYVNRWKRSVIQHLRSKHKQSPPYRPLMIRKKIDKLNQYFFNGGDPTSPPNSIIKQLESSEKPSVDDDDEQDSDFEEDKLEMTECDEKTEYSPIESIKLNQDCSSGSLDLTTATVSTKPLVQQRLVWVCTMCKYNHPFKAVLVNHLKNVHSIFTPSKEHLMRSRIRENRHPLREETSDSAMIKPKPGTKGFYCKICRRTCNTLKGLKEHNDGMHTNMVWVCKLCPYSDKWRPQCIRHLRNKHNCLPPYNENMFRRKVSLIDESKVSSIDDGEFDGVNGNSCRSSSIEKSIVNGDEIGFSLVEDKVTELSEFCRIVDNQLQCRLCGDFFVDSTAFGYHYENRHLTVLYRCKMCNFSDHCLTVASEHVRSKHDNSNVDDCIEKENLNGNNDFMIDGEFDAEFDEMYTNSMLMNINGTTHNGTVHDYRPRGDELYEKQYVQDLNQLRCRSCLSVFTSIQGFTEHYDAIHLDIVWTCRLCNVSFRWRQQLTKHLKLIHRFEAPFNEFMLKETGSYKLKKPVKNSTINTTANKLRKSTGGDVDVKLEQTGGDSLSLNHEDSVGNSIKVRHRSPYSTSEKSLASRQYSYVNNQFSCKLCVAVFGSLQGFQEHHEAIHLMIVYSCKICGFENRWRPQVTAHLRRDHQCEPPYSEYMYKKTTSNVNVKTRRKAQAIESVVAADF